jgi:hypothetical protein
MAFKVPLPKVLANQHKSTSCENPVGSQLNLPSFNKSDLSNLTLIGQGAFGKVFKCIKDGEMTSTHLDDNDVSATVTVSRRRSLNCSTDGGWSRTRMERQP